MNTIFGINIPSYIVVEEIDGNKFEHILNTTNVDVAEKHFNNVITTYTDSDTIHKVKLINMNNNAIIKQYDSTTDKC